MGAVMQKGDIIRYAGKRFVADYHNSLGNWFFLPTLKDGVTPDRRRSVYCFGDAEPLKISGKRKIIVTGKQIGRAHV